MLKIDLIAVGTKPPEWITQGIEDYTSRMKRDCQFTIREIKVADRRKPQSVDGYKKEEARGLLSALSDGAKVIAMDSGGSIWDTPKLASSIENWSQQTNHFQFMVGGPDGLASECLKRADDTWSLSRLTFPHFMVRVLLAEQIYRALMINANHPYHK